MSINNISVQNTFGQLVTTVSALVAVSNNFTDGPQSQTGSTWTFTNSNVGVNVTGTLLSTIANVGILNVSQANVTNETVGRSNISTANVTTANVVGATITNIISTDHLSANANISGLLQVSDRANIFSANIQTANIGALGVTTLSVTELTVPVLNASFANVTTLSVTGTSQHTAIIAVLTTTDNANVIRLNTTTANITGLTAVNMNASVGNVTTLTVGTLTTNSSVAIGATFNTLNATFANITTETVGTMNVSVANATSLFANVANLVSVNIASANLITGFMSANPTVNLGISTKAYADIAANLFQQLYTAKGDILVANQGANAVRLAAGTNGQSLIIDTNTTSGARWASRGPAQTFRGLSLQTSVTDKIANGTQIVLERVDEIVMDDGEIVTGWTEKSLIINTANTGNIGGLDTGTVLANTWYELYAIRKRVDGTKGFIIHRAPDRKVDQNTANLVVWAHNITVQVNRVTSPNVRVAQSFVANSSGPLTSFEMRMFKTGTPTGNVWLTLHANTAGDPDATPMATSRRYDVARMAITTHYPIRFVFDVTANVVATNSYFAVAQTDFAASDTNHITLQGSTAVNSTGVVKGNTGASWVALTPGVGTLIIKEYVETNSTPITFPAGYDQRCLVSYVATDQVSRIREFTQRDRTVMCPFSTQWNGFSLVGAEKEVCDLTAVLPPVTVIASLILFTGTMVPAVVGRLHAIDLVVVIAEGLLGGMTFGSTMGGTTQTNFAPVWIEQQTVNARVQSGTCRVYPSYFTF